MEVNEYELQEYILKIDENTPHHTTTHTGAGWPSHLVRYHPILWPTTPTKHGRQALGTIVEHPEFTLYCWIEAAMSRETIEGYTRWVNRQLLESRGLQHDPNELDAYTRPYD